MAPETFRAAMIDISRVKGTKASRTPGAPSSCSQAGFKSSIDFSKDWPFPS